MTESGTVDVREQFAAEPAEPLVPGRFRKPLCHVVEGAADAELVRDLAHWLRNHRGLAGWQGTAWEVLGFDLEGGTLPARVRKLVDYHLTDELLERLAVPEFDHCGSEIHPLLLHHGGRIDWQDDWIGPDGKPSTSRRIAFDLLLHTEQRMFQGGQIEFPSGGLVEPSVGSLVFRHPLQARRVVPVECWSAETLHGLWMLTGWIHGPAPAGWVERVERLRCVPEA